MPGQYAQDLGQVTLPLHRALVVRAVRRDDLRAVRETGTPEGEVVGVPADHVGGCRLGQPPAEGPDRISMAGTAGGAALVADRDEIQPPRQRHREREAGFVGRVVVAREPGGAAVRFALEVARPRRGASPDEPTRCPAVVDVVQLAAIGDAGRERVPGPDRTPRFDHELVLASAGPGRAPPVDRDRLHPQTVEVEVERRQPLRGPGVHGGDGRQGEVLRQVVHHHWYAGRCSRGCRRPG